MGGFPINYSNMLSAGMVAEATENWSDSTKGAALSLKTTPNGTTNSNTVIRLGQDGSVQIESLSPSKYVKTDASSKLTAEALTITTSEIADGSITTPKIANNAVTGAKIENVITKSGSLDGESYGIDFTNTGSGMFGLLPVRMAFDNGTTVFNLLHFNEAAPAPFGGATMLTSGKNLILSSLNDAGTAISLGNSSGVGDYTETMRIAGDGVVTIQSLPPSLYVKTTASKALTAEALTITTSEIADGSITTPKIADLNVTGAKLSDQIIKSGVLNDAAYSITLSNEGTGDSTITPGLGSVSNALAMQTGGELVGLIQLSSSPGPIPGAGLLYASNGMFIASSIVKLTSQYPILAIDTEGGQIRFTNEIGTNTDLITVDQYGVTTIKSLPPSLYVKTTANQALTAEAIDLSSGMSGTLGINHGGTGIASYPSSGEILIGDGLNNYSLRLISGDVSMNYVGNIAIRNGIISNDKISGDFVLPIVKGGTGTVSYPGSGEILVGPYMPGLNYAPRTMSGDVTMGWTGITTISNGAITGDKLDFFLTKSGSLDAQPMGLNFVNTGAGAFGLIATLISLDNGTNNLSLGQINETTTGPFTGGSYVGATKNLFLASGIDSGNGIIFGAANPGVPGDFTETAKIAENGVVTIQSLPPSLHVKTTATHALTAEALNITTSEIANGSITTPKIADLNVTGSKLSDQILKSGSLSNDTYSITLSNEGTGSVILPDLGIPFTNALLMNNAGKSAIFGTIDPTSPVFAGTTLIGSNYSVLNYAPSILTRADNSLTFSSPSLSFNADTSGGTIKFNSDDGGDPGVITELLTISDAGVVTVPSIPPSLYVKTTSTHALTAEAINLSSGMTGTLGIQYGGTGTPEYPGSGEILIGDGLDNYSLRLISGDVSMNHLGAVAIRSGVITIDKLAPNFVLPLSQGGTGASTYNYYGVVYPGPGGLVSTLAGPSGTVLKGTGMIPMFGQVVTAEIAAAAVTTETIADNSVTGSKLSDQIIKSGTLNGAAYSITLSNEGTGDPGIFPFPISNGLFMSSGGHWGGLFQLSSASPIPGAVGVFSDYFSILGSGQLTKVTGTDVQLAIDTAGGQLRVINDTGAEAVDLLTVDENGVTTVKSLPPSLYVKTTASQALTAEAINLSSGMAGTLEVIHGGTGIASYPGSGEILIGNGLDNYSLRTISGDVSMNYIGDIAIRDGVITSGKLAPSFILPVTRGGTGATIYPSGEIVYGNGANSLQSSSTFKWDNIDKSLHIFNEGTSTQTNLTITQADDTGSGNNVPLFFAQRARGTISAPTSSQAGDLLGAFVMGGYGNSGYSPGAGMASIASENWTDSANGTDLYLISNPAGQVMENPLTNAVKISGGAISTSGNISTEGIMHVGSTLEVSGRTVYSPSDTNVITSALGVTAAMIGKKVILIAGDGAGTTDISENPQIAFGQNGQEIVLIGTSDTDLVKFDNGNGLQLSAATSFTLGAGDIMQLIYVGSIGKWVEISRTDN